MVLEKQLYYRMQQQPDLFTLLSYGIRMFTYFNYIILTVFN